MKKVCVIGSGMVGVSCALNLLEKQYQVTLLERHETTIETSYGNAGVITRSSALLLNNKTLIPNLKHYLFNQHPAVRLSYPYILKNLKWALGFLKQSPACFSEKNIKSLDSLIKVSLDEHLKWMQKSNQTDRLRDTGWLKLYRSKASMQSNGYEKAIYDELGIAYRELDSQALQDLEPALAPIYTGALLIQDAASVNNPGALVEGYKKLFIESGGQLVQDDVQQLIELQGDSTSSVLVKGKQADYSADYVVIAAGPWSNDILQSIARPLPMGFERGYHEHYEIPVDAPHHLTRPVYDVEEAFVMTPTSLGYRLTSGSEIKDKAAPASPVQLQAIRHAANQAVSLGPLKPQSDWQGSRPTLVDSLPAIGKCPGTSHIWLAFGHQHVGFSTGPATGRLLAELIHNETPYIDATPFNPARFTS
ncbi:FAD-binding oxidoreductase [Marinomonas sp. THO17]|uniref:NAD(P)/FAD-dependent oxidoreductase n=1 Tax=Marinomonas sp. THO17 TaxID=3149048 RepID=UPI00336BB4E2